MPEHLHSLEAHHPEQHSHSEHSHGDHSHGDHSHGHDHVHGVVDPALLSNERGIWAVKWSLAGLFLTACLQVVVVALTGSVGLLADTIHNFGDALTAIPLWVAFRLSRRQPNQRFTYGYGRAEDLAGIAVVLLILFSAAVAGYESIDRFLHPHPLEHVWVVAAAALIGFLGNEAVSVFRIKVGKEIHSAALVADGQHARIDALTSLAVLVGAVGSAVGIPWADPLVGLAISFAILKVVWDSARPVLTRALDGIEPDIAGEIVHAATHVGGVQDVQDVRARWIGHRLYAELDIAVDPALSVAQAHEIGVDVRHALLHQVVTLSDVSVRIDPRGVPPHSSIEHAHDGLPVHVHY